MKREHSSGVSITQKPAPKPTTQVIITMPDTAATELQKSLTAMPFTQDQHPVLWDVWDLLNGIVR